MLIVARFMYTVVSTPPALCGCLTLSLRFGGRRGVSTCAYAVLRTAPLSYSITLLLYSSLGIIIFYSIVCTLYRGKMRSSGRVDLVYS